MQLPNFEVVSDVPGEPLVVRDLGPWHQYPTITNAAEELVDHLVTVGLLTLSRKLHYYDSEGNLDGIRTEGSRGQGRFNGFYPIQTRGRW